MTAHEHQKDNVVVPKMKLKKQQSSPPMPLHAYATMNGMMDYRSAGHTSLTDDEQQRHSFKKHKYQSYPILPASVPSTTATTTTKKHHHQISSSNSLSHSAVLNILEEHVAGAGAMTGKQLFTSSPIEEEEKYNSDYLDV